MMAGKKMCNCLRYSKGSSSISKKPKDLPKATVEMTSRVKKVVIRARFIGLYTVSVETYFRPMRPNIRMRCSSMSLSRQRFSFPEYCQDIIVRIMLIIRDDEAQHDQERLFEKLTPCDI